MFTVVAGVSVVTVVVMDGELVLLGKLAATVVVLCMEVVSGEIVEFVVEEASGDNPVIPSDDT